MSNTNAYNKAKKNRRRLPVFVFAHENMRRESISFYMRLNIHLLRMERIHFLLF